MKLGITKEQLPIIAGRSVRYFGGIIAGIGIGLLLAVSFIPHDHAILHFDYFMTAWLLVCAGTITASLAGLFHRGQ